MLEEHRLDALLYPTLRRKPARIGDGQGGSTCQLSANSGLPALAVPAGFTSDELPVGIDLLGAAFSEQRLLSVGYSVERLLNLRRPPFATPALVDGKAPRARQQTVSLFEGSASGGTSDARLELTYDPSTATLTQTVVLPAPRRSDVRAVWLHAGTAEKPGGARHQLYAAGHPTTGHVTLSAADRRGLADEGLRIRVYYVGAQGVPRDLPLRLR